MKIVPASASLLPVINSTDQIDLLKRIEECGRVCYKSEDSITKDSCFRFVENIIKRGHEAVLEHASIIMKMNLGAYLNLRRVLDELEEHGNYVFTSYLRFTDRPTSRCIVSGNIRAWRDAAKAIGLAKCEYPGFFRLLFRGYPALFPEFVDMPCRVDEFSFQASILRPNDMVTDAERLTHVDRTVRFVCDRGVSHEIVRHRPASYCQESTRYCNYALGKFGEEITVIDPAALNLNQSTYSHWEWGCKSAEKAYFQMLAMGATAQAARSVLPNSLKTEVVMTATNGEWLHFHRLRCAPAAHPQMQEVAKKSLVLLHESEVRLYGVVHREVFGG